MEKEELRRLEERRRVVASLTANPRVFRSIINMHEEQDVEKLASISSRVRLERAVMQVSVLIRVLGAVCHQMWQSL